MLEPKPATQTQTMTKWLVPIAAIFALGAWIYIAPPGLMGKLDAIGYAVCHRLSSHSLFVDGIQFPLCARCTGEFNAAAIALILQGFMSSKEKQTSQSRDYCCTHFLLPSLRNRRKQFLPRIAQTKLWNSVHGDSESLRHRQYNQSLHWKRHGNCNGIRSLSDVQPDDLARSRR